MTEQKKGPKQASIAAFFSPQKADANQRAAEIEAEAAASKKKAEEEKKIKDAKKDKKPDETQATKSNGSEVDADATGDTPAEAPKESRTKPKAKPKAKAKATPKAKAKAKASPKKEKKKRPRFTSPHAMVSDDDDEEFDDEDAFNTPEAKKAREELEAVQAAAAAKDAVLDAQAEETELNEDEVPEEIVDLTAADKEDSDAEKPKARKARGKKAAAAVKTPTKRQQKMKEKAAAAEAKPAPVEPLDPATQARVDTYKAKTDELTRQYMDLLTSTSESDTVMQEIYGVALDYNLDVSVEGDKAHEALVSTWQKLREHSLAVAKAADPAAVPAMGEFPHEVKCLIAKSIQGRSSSLSVLAHELVASFKKDVDGGDVDMETSDKQLSSANAADSAAAVVVEMEIKMLAQRTPHGVRPPKANLFEDTSADALWIWEVGNLEKYFGDEAQKTIKRMRKNRKRLGMQLKTLARVLQLLHKKPVDEVKVSAEEAKVGKFGLVVDAELQKAKERELKEQEKLHAAEEKKRHELERQQAKEEEKRKREREAEEQKEVSAKRRKSMVSYFRSIDTETAAASGTNTDDTVIDVTGEKEEHDSQEVIARMDAAIGFLGSASSSSAVDSSQLFSSLKDKREAKSRTEKQHPKAWSARRYRDPKLGVMKLLQFYDNNRPAYNGTFSKRSRIFRGGRRPFAHYAKFDYSVDSDDEWEEEEPGESLSDADSEGEESDEDNLDYGDQWLAYEDEVDYMDGAEEEDDPMEGGEGPSSPSKHKLPSQLQKKRVKAKGVKPSKLEPQITGPFWCTYSDDDVCTDEHFADCAGELLCEPAFESTLMRKAREHDEQEKLRAEQQKLKEEEKRKQQEQKQKQAQEEKQKATQTPVTTSTASSKSATPQKPQRAQKPTAKRSPSPGHAKAPAPTATPSPAKAAKPPVKPIDAFFKKIPASSTPPQESATTQQQKQDEQKQEKPATEVISVD